LKKTVTICVVSICLCISLAISLWLNLNLKKSYNENALLEAKITELQDVKNATQSKNVEIKRETDTRNGEENIIDQKYDKAMSEWSGNTSEGVDIITSYGDIWKVEMNKYYNQLNDELTDDKRIWLVSSQKKWEEFTKENEGLTWHTYDQINHEGSIMQIYSAEIYLDSYKSRAIELKTLYEFLTADR